MLVCQLDVHCAQCCSTAMPQVGGKGHARTACWSLLPPITAPSEQGGSVWCRWLVACK